MNVKKILILFFLPVMPMLLCPTSGFCDPSFIIQKLIVPYVSINPTAGYWTGISIKNQSDTEEIFSLYASNEDGMEIATRNCVRVPARSMKTDLLENFFGSPVSGRITLHIKSTRDGASRFEVTVFMGKTGGKNAGFAFQTYRSEDRLVGALIRCSKSNP